MNKRKTASTSLRADPHSAHPRKASNPSTSHVPGHQRRQATTASSSRQYHAKHHQRVHKGKQVNTQRRSAVDIVTDVLEMRAEGYGHDDIARYLKRAYTLD
jgi:hypothetical protein